MYTVNTLNTHVCYGVNDGDGPKVNTARAGGRPMGRLVSRAENAAQPRSPSVTPTARAPLPESLANRRSRTPVPFTPPATAAYPRTNSHLHQRRRRRHKSSAHGAYAGSSLPLLAARRTYPFRSSSTSSLWLCGCCCYYIIIIPSLLSWYTSDSLYSVVICRPYSNN